jgi:hypothetical protein
MKKRNSGLRNQSKKIKSQMKIKLNKNKNHPNSKLMNLIILMKI